MFTIHTGTPGAKYTTLHLDETLHDADEDATYSLTVRVVYAPHTAPENSGYQFTYWMDDHSLGHEFEVISAKEHERRCAQARDNGDEYDMPVRIGDGRHDPVAQEAFRRCTDAAKKIQALHELYVFRLPINA